jgi:PEGA domain
MQTAILFVLLASAAVGAQDKPTIYIAGEGNTTVGSAGGIWGGLGAAVGVSQTSINKHNQTMEMAEDFTKFCPSVQASLDTTKTPDYFVTLNREPGKSQIMVLNRGKVVVFATKKGSVAKAVQDACTAIADDWKTHGRLPISTTAIEDLMANSEASKSSPAAAAALATEGKDLSPRELLALINKGEASRCAVLTTPAGAEVDIDGNKAGITPLAFVLLRRDTPRVVTVKMDGYKTVEKQIVPDGKVVPISV